ncbi:MAG TPA: hypothetical protein VK831_03060, partial [Candidatus Deferrimicrobiaceae bacterium]|nr:hypothetical protein [Candidatus Deferrimicrobiaceae bacterium]
ALPAAQLAGDRGLLARVLAALGAALVHGVRGHDGEAARHLHEAASLAGESGDLETVARAERELGYVEMLRGRYDRAERWLTDAADAGVGSAVESAWSRAVRAAALSDVGLHDRAITELADVLALARDRRLTQVEAWALTFLGRAQLLQGEHGAAMESLTAATAAAEAANWTSFVPLPQALLADALLAERAIDAAEAAYERAHALALQLDDPCWEGIAGRGLGLVAAERGDLDAAFTRLTDARRRCVRVPDAWLWVEAYCLDALAGLAVAADPARAEVWITDLETLAAKTGMREFVTRAYLHRARLGDESAKQAVAVLAAEIENPSLSIT